MVIFFKYNKSSLTYHVMAWWPQIKLCGGKSGTFRRRSWERLETKNLPDSSLASPLLISAPAVALSAKQLVKRRELHCVKDWEFNMTNLIHNKKLVQKKMNERVGTRNFLVGNPTRSLQTQPRTKRRRSIRRNFDRQLNCLITQSAFKILRWIACQWRAKYISGAVNLEHANFNANFST